MNPCFNSSKFDFSRDDEDDGAEGDMNNLDTTIQVSPIPTTRINQDHPLDQEEPKKVIHTLKDPSCDKRLIQEDPLQFKYTRSLDLVDLPNMEKGLYAQGKIKEEVYVCQPPGFEDPDFPDRVYKVEKALYGLHQAPRAWYETLSTYLLDNGFQRGKIDKTLFIRRYKGDILLMSSKGELAFFLGLQVQQKKDGIFICQDKYVDEILKKFRFTEVKTASTPRETQKPLLKDEDGEEMDVHMYRLMISSLMYLTTSRPDIMFAVCQPKLGLWYSKDSPFDLVAYTDSDYAGASLEILGKRVLQQEVVIPWISNTTAWNEFSSTMAAAIICLATNQKFNFSKYTFESMIRNLDNLSGKFLMYPRFVQVFLNQQLDGLPNHKRIYIAPSHTKKIFGNMRRVGKGFSGRVTPLFPTMVVQNQSKLGEGSANPTNPHHTPIIIQLSTQPQKTQKTRKPKRKGTQVPQPSNPSENVTDEAVHKELGNSLVRAATTASSLEAEQDSGNITKTRSKATPNESSSLGTTSSGGPRCQETMGDTIAQTRFEKISKHSNDSLLARGNTLRSDEDRLKLNELMELCTNLQNRVLDLEKTKTTQQNEIDSLKRRVKKLEKKRSSRTHKLKRLYKIDDVDNEMFDVNALNGEELVLLVMQQLLVLLQQLLLQLQLLTIKSTKPKEKGVVIQELGESTTTISSQQSQGKGREILTEPVKPMKKKDQDQISFDEETTLKLQAEFDEEERLAREKVEKEKKPILP
ncbi:uncharacterized mitochondrial protein-like protein [Tanacetum coccineum]|uniref:Uncharacterized mitochondrial protein-like protein n=1 Tax=Tanacetum coccineum TaxID=301880 RepID=A0ABQ5I340_9ASTR